MDPIQPVPEAISHRQLAHLLQSAVADPAAAEASGGDGVEGGSSPELDALLQAYGELSVRLLKAFEGAGDELARGRTPRQLMAMGALRAHAHMALQALTASRA
ncbi:hypothetical protein [Cyanobium sp. CH-040]|uniref:hypothetical protein n=1 Tax=Cyanobium sp. CH-040 TaxID=2823708 RepID=UPI0020CD58B1|nr:hypothetical protein [Cyanobium sp. CH-040]MCP9927762.1 hypothetical protein [Cyanobium sp. CH-040]